MNPSMNRTRTKYGARKTVVDGVRYDSKREALRARDLEMLQASGQISKLARQVTLRIVVRGELIARYVADFVYEEEGRVVVEDVKGYPTPEFKLKWKLVQALYPEFVFRLT